jgi:RNA polymerase sigma-70 factor (ECF subfamily)
MAFMFCILICHLAFCIVIFDIFCHVLACCAFIIVMIVGSVKLRRAADVDDDNRLAIQPRNDPAALVQLYRRHYEAIFRYCAHRLFERAAAEDVTSEVFLKMVENFHRFRGTEEQFRNWLYRIATNGVNNHLRRMNRRNGLLRAACEQSNNQAADCGESPEMLALLREAMLSLKPRYQTIITLRFFENVKLTEIAEVLGSSPGTIRSQLARALATLRKRFVVDSRTEPCMES